MAEYKVGGASVVSVLGGRGSDWSKTSAFLDRVGSCFGVGLGNLGLDGRLSCCEAWDYHYC